MKSDRGFAQVFLISALPFVLGIIIFLYFWLSFFRLEMTMRHQSREVQIATQDRARKLLNALMDKNPAARNLRIQHQLAIAALAAAVASANGPAIEAAKLRLEAIRFKREALDFTQKALIQAANLDLRLSSERLYGQLVREVRKQSYLRDSFVVEAWPDRPIIPRLAVVPAYPDIAPEYRTQEAFPARQAMAQGWQYKIRVASPLRKFFGGEARFQKESRITLAGDFGQWRIENRTGKF